MLRESGAERSQRVACAARKEEGRVEGPTPKRKRSRVTFTEGGGRHGPINAALLPGHITRLHDCLPADHLTFLFAGTIAGVSGQVLWDSGASLSFVDAAFARTHNLHISPSNQLIRLADGSEVPSEGCAHVKVRIQAYTACLRLHVLPLSDAFSVILGDEWSRAHCVAANYGFEGAEGDGGPRVPAHLHLQGKHIKLYPEIEAPPPPPGGAEQRTGRLLTAQQAARFIRSPRNGCSKPFLAVLRDSKGPASAPTERVQSLVEQSADVFEEPAAGTFAGEATEAIPTEPGAPPPNRMPFRLSMAERKEVEEQLAKMLDKGWIQTSSSAYGAPVLFVPKPDGSLRMCIDYRALNHITTKNKYPLPRIDDLLDNLAGATCFSSLDLTSGYHQLVLQDSDVPKTAFNTHVGKYEYKVLPMGLANAPAVFQSAMHRVFSRQLNRFVCVYLDDILVFSRNEEEHLAHLEQVLQVLREHNLKAKMAKCEFFKPSLKFLGHVVSATGMKPDPAKVQVIEEWPEPETVFDVRSFLGLANYFRKYILGFAKMVAPLTHLLKGLSKQEKKGRQLRRGRLSDAEAAELKADLKQRWAPEARQAFLDVKRALTSAPVLVLPNFSKPFELVADACQQPSAIGAVLLQEGRPVAFYSRKLSGAELNYCASDIEMLALIYALKEWRCYLEGATVPFLLVTDHKPNTYLDVANNAHTLHRRARWLSMTCGYNYQWVYREGRLNVADPISRAPHTLRPRAPSLLCRTPSRTGERCGALRVCLHLVRPIRPRQLCPRRRRATRGGVVLCALGLVCCGRVRPGRLGTLSGLPAVLRLLRGGMTRPRRRRTLPHRKRTPLLMRRPRLLWRTLRKLLPTLGPWQISFRWRLISGITLSSGSRLDTPQTRC